MNAQETLWAGLDVIGPWLWFIEPLLCALAFVVLVLRAPPNCWLDRVGRYLAMLGLLGLCAAVFNTAFGPPGRIVFMVGYLLTILHRRREEVRRGDVRPKESGSNPAGLVTVGVVVIAAVMLTLPAMAQSGHHGQGHAQHHDWYKGLTVPGNPAISCCSDEDCRPTRAWRDDAGDWHALVNGKIRKVPADRVLTTPAPDGRSHVCATSDDRIICFVGGVPQI